MAGKAVTAAGVLGEGNEGWWMVGRIGSGGGSIMHDNILDHAHCRGGYPGVLILVFGWVLLSVRLPVPPLLALITEAQFQPRAVRVDRVIDGDGGSTAGPDPTGSVGLQPFFLDQCKRITGTGC